VNIKARLSGLDRMQMIEVIHLVSRYLGESPRSRAELTRILALDAQGGEPVTTAVTSIIDQIEAEEGRQIEALDSGVRARRIKALDKLLWNQIDRDGVNLKEVDGALEALRKVS